MTEHTVLDQIAARAEATRIVRWHDGRVAAGVARGLAARFDLDPVVVRVAFVVAATLGGVGIAAYLTAWALLPDEEGAIPLIRAVREKAAGSIALVALAGLITVSVLTGLGDDRGVLRLAGLVALVGAGWWIWRRSSGQPTSYDGTAPRQEAGGPETSAPDASASTRATGGSGGTAAGQPHTMPVITPWGGVDGERVGTYAAPTTGMPAGTGAAGRASGSGYGAPAHPGAYAPAPHAARVVTAPRPPKPRRRSLGGRLWLIAIGLCILTSIVVHQVAVSLGQGSDTAALMALAATAVVLGLLVVVVGLRGYRTSGIVPVAALIGVAALVAPMAPPVDGSVGEISWRPGSLTELNRSYDLGMGEGTLDLRGLSATDLGGRSVTAEVGLGSLIIRVPADVAVDVRPDVGLGSLKVKDSNGTVQQWDGPNDPDAFVVGSGPQLTLDVKVGLGEVTIERIAR